MSFRIKGCRVTLSYYFFAMAAALVFFCHDGLFLCGLAAAAFHELGHIIAILLCRDAVIKDISIGALGIRMTASGGTDRPMIMLAGVAANLLLSLASLPFIRYSWGGALLGANICLAACNILPIEPLDGGVLMRWMAERHLSPEAAERTVLAVSVCAIFPLTAAGLLAVMQSRGNFSLLILCLWLLAGILKRYI